MLGYDTIRDKALFRSRDTKQVPVSVSVSQAARQIEMYDVIWCYGKYCSYSD